MSKNPALRNHRLLSPRPALLLLIIFVATVTVVDSAFSQSEFKKAIPTKSSFPPLETKLEEYPVIVPFPDGKLMAVVLNNDWIRKAETEAVARYSTDNGHTWSERQTLFKFPKEPRGGWGVQIGMLDQKGEIHLFYHNDEGTGSAPKTQATAPVLPAEPFKSETELRLGVRLEDLRFDIWHTKTINGRKEWQPLKRIWKGYAGSMLSVTQMQNGRFILPITYLTTPYRTWSNRGKGSDAFAFMGRFSSTVLYSDDGDNWAQSPVEFKAPTLTIDGDGLLEPGVVELKDGRVWLLMRTQLGRFFESYSVDGATWSPPQPTDIFSSDSPGTLIRVKSGAIVMVWNNCLRFPFAQGGRHMLHAAISDDAGKTWRGFREVTRDPFIDEPPQASHPGVTYAVLNLTQAGTVITPMNPRDGFAFLLHIDPAWLYETTRKTDFSANLASWSTFGTRGVEIAPHPQESGARVLSLRKTKAEWPAGAVWNFPAGVKGSLSVKLLIKPGFRGALIGLTDHFSVPFDFEEQIYNLFNLKIGPDGELANGQRIAPGRWHQLRLDWDTFKSQCRVLLDGHQIEALPLTRMTRFGASYFRIHSTAESTDDAGLLIESIDADTSASWSILKRSRAK